METRINTLLEECLVATEYSMPQKEVVNNFGVLLKNTSVSSLKVSIASLVAKTLFPSWDTRNHQKGSTEDGKSLRTVDAFVSRYLCRKGLYNTPTEGALTRSLEQPHPYTLDYPGKITPKVAKEAFLGLMHCVNTDEDFSSKDTLCWVLNELQEKTRVNKNTLSSSRDNPVDTISYGTLQDILTKIFSLPGQVSRIPEIALHTLCELCFGSFDRYTVKALKYHTACDKNSLSFGDVEVYNYNRICAVYEVKSKLKIKDNFIDIFKSKTGLLPESVTKVIVTTAEEKGRYVEGIRVINLVNYILDTLNTSYMYGNSITCVDYLSEFRKCMSNDLGLNSDVKLAIQKILQVEILGVRYR